MSTWIWSGNETSRVEFRVHGLRAAPLSLRQASILDRDGMVLLINLFFLQHQRAMAGLQYVQRLFSLNTLDTRFTTSSRANPREQLLNDSARVVPDGGAHNLRSHRDASTNADTNLPASRWTTPEFMIYAVIFLIAIPLMIKSVYEVSNRKCSFLLSIKSTKIRTSY